MSSDQASTRNQHSEIHLSLVQMYDLFLLSFIEVFLFILVDNTLRLYKQLARAGYGQWCLLTCSALVLIGQDFIQHCLNDVSSSCDQLNFPLKLCFQHCTKILFTRTYPRANNFFCQSSIYYKQFCYLGQVLMMTSPDNPYIALPKLRQRTAKCQGILHGYYKLCGDQVCFFHDVCCPVLV